MGTRLREACWCENPFSHPSSNPFLCVKMDRERILGPARRASWFLRLASFHDKTAAETTIVLTLSLERLRFYLSCIPPERHCAFAGPPREPSAPTAAYHTIAVPPAPIVVLAVPLDGLDRFGGVGRQVFTGLRLPRQRSGPVVAPGAAVVWRSRVMKACRVQRCRGVARAEWWASSSRARDD